MAHCKNCGVEVIGQFCAECGTSKGNGNNFCAGCGGKNDKPDWKFCVHCGEKNTVAAAPANACSCGQVYLPNARFCPACGEPRPGLGNSGGVDSGPAPGVPKRRVAPPPPIPGRAANGLNTSNDGSNISPRGNGASNGWNQQPTQTVEVSAPQPWSPPRSAPTPININSNTSSYNTAPAASSPVYNSAPSQFAIPAAPPQPVKEEKKKKSLKDKLKAKLVGGGWLIDKSAPQKTSTPASTSPTTSKQPLSTSPSSGGKDVTTNRILEHIQKNYNDPAPGSSPQMSTSPRNPSPISTPSNNYVPSPPPQPTRPVVNNTTPPPPPTRPTVTPTATVTTAPPPPPTKQTPPPAPSKTKEELIPKKEGEVVLTGSSFGKQPTAKPIQKVNVPPPPPGIKNKDNRMSLNTILAESTNYDGSAYQATIISHEDRADAIDTSKKVTLYKIAVAQGGKNWAVFRRVAQFEELDKRLKKKGALGPNEASVKKKKEKDQMLQELEKYLVVLLSKPETAGHHYVHNFLQPTQIGDVKPT